MQPAVFLDRDNTLIATEGDIGDPAQVQLIHGVATGLRRLRDAGFRLVVVTNQGGVARGTCTESEVDAVHMRIATLVDEAAQCNNLIERFYYCPYHPEATVAEFRRDHPWRKPHPGMMIQASRDLGLDLGRSWLIGDRVRDIQAGRAAGCQTILISSDPHDAADAHPSAVVEQFEDAVELILRESRLDHHEDHHAHNGSNGEAGVYARTGNTVEREAMTSSAVLSELATMRRTMFDLAEDIRAEQVRRSEFTPLRLAAGVAQLMVLLLALLGLLHMDQSDAFFKWMIGAGLAQLLTIAMLLADRRG